MLDEDHRSTPRSQHLAAQTRQPRRFPVAAQLSGKGSDGSSLEEFTLRMPSPRQIRPSVRAFLLAGWVACSLYVWTTLDHGWIPHDEGTIAHAAERVLSGELPHRDFEDVYTGGQAMLHALALSLRDDLLGPRITVFCFFVLWIPVVYWIARRFAGIWVASATTLLSISLGLPLYPAAMPSWYNLYLATFGLAALIAWFESANRWWLFFAGLTAGVSILFKISGLYFTAAALLAIVIGEIGRPADAGSEMAFPILVTLGGVVLTAMVSALVIPRGSVADVLYFVVPVAFVCLVISAWIWLRRTGLEFRTRLAHLGRTLLPFGVGCAAPVALFLIPYLLSGSLDDLIRGLFILPAMRFEFAAKAPPPVASWLFLPALTGAFLIAEFSRGIRNPFGYSILLGVLVVFLWSSESQWGYLASWLPLYHLPVITVVAGCGVIGRRMIRRWRSGDPSDSPLDVRVLVLVVTSAFCSLVQYPFAAPIYAAYVAPLALLALLGVLSANHVDAGRGPLTVFPYLAVFLVLRAHPGTIRELGVHPGERVYTERLTLERGGILVTPAEKFQYERTVHLLQAHADGHFTLSAPDSPEIYYLSGLSNPTRRLYGFFAADDGEPDDILSTIRTNGIRAVAINREPDFSAPISSPISDSIAARLPRSERVGKFTVRWIP